MTRLKYWIHVIADFFKHLLSCHIFSWGFIPFIHIARRLFFYKKKISIFYQAIIKRRIFIPTSGQMEIIVIYLLWWFKSMYNIQIYLKYICIYYGGLYQKSAIGVTIRSFHYKIPVIFFHKGSPDVNWINSLLFVFQSIVFFYL